MRFSKSLLKCLALAAGLVPVSSCANLGMLGQALRAPNVKFREAKLVGYPTPQALLAHFCPRVLAEKSPFGAAAAGVACNSLVGPPPSQADLEIAFDVGLGVSNPNQIPLPIDAILTAVTVFPDANTEKLGTACVQLCNPGDATCQGGSNPEACRSTQNDLRGIQDYPRALANLLDARAASTTAGPMDKPFTLPSIPAGANTDVVVRFAFLPERLLPSLEPLARQALDKVRVGGEPELDVPYRVEGTLFASAGALGRVAAAFGPVAGAWTLKGPLRR